MIFTSFRENFFVGLGLVILTLMVFFLPLLKVTTTLSEAEVPEKLLFAVIVKDLALEEIFTDRRPLILVTFLI